MILHIDKMFLCNRGAIIAFILLFLAHLDATERKEKLKESSRSSVSTNGIDRLKKVHDSDIEKLIAGSTKYIRSRPSAKDNRSNVSSKSSENERESSRSLNTSTKKTTGKIRKLKTKTDTKKQPKLSILRKSQERNVNQRKNKITPIKGCSGGKGNKKGHACHEAGRKKRTIINIPGAEVVETYNQTFVIPIPMWWWPGIWAIFG